MTTEPEAQCDGRHPLVWPDGTQTYLYDLVAHDGCPHQTWARPAKTDQELADELWPAWTAFRRPIPGVTSSYRQRPVLPEGCYDASFGRVHVRPGCRC